jgi:hypothetical protein
VSPDPPPGDDPFACVLGFWQATAVNVTQVVGAEVFAWSAGTSDKLFQLAVNKDGVLRGTYFDAFTDTTLPVYGQVDQKSQRAAWTVGEKTTVVYEAGCANLTRDETPVLVHLGKDSTQQFVLVHLPPPDDPPGR